MPLHALTSVVLPLTKFRLIDLNDDKLPTDRNGIRKQPVLTYLPAEHNSVGDYLLCQAQVLHDIAMGCSINRFHDDVHYRRKIEMRSLKPRIVTNRHL